MYPTRAVRHAAWDALDSLFPVSILITRSNARNISSKTLAHKIWTGLAYDIVILPCRWGVTRGISSVYFSGCCIHGTGHHRAGTLWFLALRRYSIPS
ncbi:hypothetical protein Bca4012_097973 [Brassica carinata]|uniref:Uncharacterized protein n=1 Tax=Brassica carinata TaxID=52824 RepID=A0A8X7PEK1_BRACI|nr:hypothetical protein Bca52824_080662 [Brassica carinata]